jgi:hypothetical protein
MTDIDLLVRPSDRDPVLAALESAGFARQVNSERPFSAMALGETCLRAPRECLGTWVEVQTQLDKVVGRPVDYEAIFARSMPVPDLASLRLPSIEDQVLLVTLHLGTANFCHPIGFTDLDRLLRTPADPVILETRSRSWRLQTVLFIALSALRSMGASSVPRELVEALRPNRLRRAALEKYFNVEGYPPAKDTLRLGWPWVLRQTLLRDDSASWCLGLAQYAALRVADRVSRVSIRS